MNQTKIQQIDNEIEENLELIENIKDRYLSANDYNRFIESLINRNTDLVKERELLR